MERVAEGEDSVAWQAALEGFDPGKAEVLKIDGSAGVWGATLGGRDCVVKMWEYRGIWGRVKMQVRASRGWRHWRGARWLEENGFATAPTEALMSERGDGVVREWLVMRRLDGPTVLEILEYSLVGTRREHALAGALGEQVSEMVARGRFNRDHKPSNLIVTGWTEGVPTVAVIDCVAIRKCRRFDFGAMRRMLASLYIEPLGVGSPPRRGLCMRALEAIRAREWWWLIVGAVQEHGDPRPRVRGKRSEMREQR